MKKRSYQPPAVLRLVLLESESALLAQSISETTSVKTMGHEVENFTIGSGDAGNTFEAPGWENFSWN